jgi:hypothetical protein
MGEIGLDNEQQRRAANRRTLIMLAAVAVAFYLGVMISVALK